MHWLQPIASLGMTSVPLMAFGSHFGLHNACCSIFCRFPQNLGPCVLAAGSVAAVSGAHTCSAPFSLSAWIVVYSVAEAVLSQVCRIWGFEY